GSRIELHARGHLVAQPALECQHSGLPSHSAPRPASDGAACGTADERGIAAVCRDWTWNQYDGDHQRVFTRARTQSVDGSVFLLRDPAAGEPADVHSNLDCGLGGSRSSHDERLCADRRSGDRRARRLDQARACKSGARIDRQHRLDPSARQRRSRGSAVPGGDGTFRSQRVGQSRLAHAHIRTLLVMHWLLLGGFIAAHVLPYIAVFRDLRVLPADRTIAAIHSPPDGYTLLLVNPANAINTTLYPKLSFNFLRDAAPVAGIMRVPNVMEVNPAVPAKTVAEFIAYAKANPGKINWATSGNGTSVHLSGELFKLMTGVELTHIPYKGSAPALTDLIAGTVQVIFDNMPPSLPHIRAGKLRALAVTTATRSEALPEVPTVADTVPGYEASAFYGMSVPKGTPPEIIEKLNKEVNAALADPNIKARLAELGGILIPGSPADFGKLVADETEKWAKVIKAGNVVLE